MLFHFAGVTGLYRPIVQGDGEGGCALEHKELPGLLRDFGDHLNARGARANDGNPFTFEVWLIVGPAAGEILLAGKGLQTLDVIFYNFP